MGSSSRLLDSTVYGLQHAGHRLADGQRTRQFWKWKFLFVRVSAGNRVLDFCLQIIDCSREAGYSEKRFDSRKFTVTPLARHAANVVVLPLEPSGRIGRHPASGHQIFAVVEGEGIVSGGDSVEHRIRAGEAAGWQPGEQHETRTEGGMTAVVSEGPDILLALPLVDLAAFLFEMGEERADQRRVEIVDVRRREQTATLVGTPAGRWLSLRAAPLSGPGGQSDIVVTFDATPRTALSRLALAAHGLTTREEDVALLVLQGASTQSIAVALHLSQHTVQGHLKRIFSKVGVTTRRDLTARLTLD